MLMQNEVRAQLDAIAEEILQSPGMYHELYSRVFSQRVRLWMQAVSKAEAEMIKRVAQLDPDYSDAPHYSDMPVAMTETGAIAPTGHLEISLPFHVMKATPIFNPAWDVQY